VQSPVLVQEMSDTFIPFVGMSSAAGTAAGLVAERLMRGDGVVDLFPMPQLAIECFHLQRTGGNLVELLAVGAVGAFDGAIERGRAREEHEQVRTALLASLFEAGGELAAAVDLHGANGKGHAVLQGRGTESQFAPWHEGALAEHPSARSRPLEAVTKEPFCLGCIFLSD